MMTTQHVVLVNEQDTEIGVEEKLRAHQLGLLHRAVSVFVFNSAGELLLQQRAREKYHSGGLWSNSCCGHPELGELPAVASARRLRQEMGMACPLHAAGAFHYQLAVGDLMEHEYDHVFYGVSDATPAPDPDEVCGWRWTSLDALDEELSMHPARFTAWLPGALERLRSGTVRPWSPLSIR